MTGSSRLDKRALRIKAHAARGRSSTLFWSMLAINSGIAISITLGFATIALADPSQLKLRDDFEGPPFSEASGLYYKDNEEQRAGKYRVQGDVVRSGAGALEVSVVPRCKRDGSKCSERAEVWERPQVLAPYHATLWYAFSMRFDDPPPIANHRYVVAQWKRAIKHGAKIDYSPFLAIRIMRGNLAITIDSDAMVAEPRSEGVAPVYCSNNQAMTEQRPEVQQTRLLVAAPAGSEVEFSTTFNSCTDMVRVIPRGGKLPRAEPRWVDFVFKIKPGPSGDGEIEVFADGKWVSSARGRIGHEGPDLGSTQYFKFGPYRDGGRMENWRVFYDNFRRGPTCEDVAESSLCNQVTTG